MLDQSHNTKQQGIVLCLTVWTMSQCGQCHNVGSVTTWAVSQRGLSQRGQCHNMGSVAVSKAIKE